MPDHEVTTDLVLRVEWTVRTCYSTDRVGLVHSSSAWEHAEVEAVDPARMRLRDEDFVKLECLRETGVSTQRIPTTSSSTRVSCEMPLMEDSEVRLCSASTAAVS